MTLEFPKTQGYRSFTARIADIENGPVWGLWEFSPKKLTLVHKKNFAIDFDRINSTADIVYCLFKCHDRHPGDLQRAFAVILDPLLNCCGDFGQSNSYAREQPFSGKECAEDYAKSLLCNQRKRKPLKPSLRYAVLERDGFRCRACGFSASEGATLHVDHIHPLSKGGSNHVDNLQALCADCNLGKGSSFAGEVRNLNQNPKKWSPVRMLTVGSPRGVDYWVNVVKQHYIPFLAKANASGFKYTTLIDWLRTHSVYHPTTSDVVPEQGHSQPIWEKHVSSALSALCADGLIRHLGQGRFCFEQRAPDHEASL